MKEESEKTVTLHIKTKDIWSGEEIKLKGLRDVFIRVYLGSYRLEKVLLDGKTPDQIAPVKRNNVFDFHPYRGTRSKVIFSRQDLEAAAIKEITIVLEKPEHKPASAGPTGGEQQQPGTQPSKEGKTGETGGKEKEERGGWIYLPYAALAFAVAVVILVVVIVLKRKGRRQEQYYQHSSHTS